jgi:nucleotide-binding universal stress UspA family protein
MTTRRRPRHLRVLLATDGSADARAAAECLARFPLPPSSVPLVLSVVTIPPSPISFPGLEDLKQSLLADGRRACEEAADVLRPRWPAVEVRVAEGEPREQILKTAKTWRPHLAVLGRRGLGGFERMLLGSVSLTAARHWPVPFSWSRALRGRSSASWWGSTARRNRSGR